MKRRPELPLDYLQRLIRAYASLDLPPHAIVARVQHERRCPVLSGKSICKCRPDIHLETSAGRIEVLPDGSTRHMSVMN